MGEDKNKQVNEILRCILCIRIYLGLLEELGENVNLVVICIIWHASWHAFIFNRVLLALVFVKAVIFCNYSMFCYSLGVIHNYQTVFFSLTPLPSQSFPIPTKYVLCTIMTIINGPLADHFKNIYFI